MIMEAYHSVEAPFGVARAREALLAALLSDDLVGRLQNRIIHLPLPEIGEVAAHGHASGQAQGRKCTFRILAEIELLIPLLHALLLRLHKRLALFSQALLEFLFVYLTDHVIFKLDFFLSDLFALVALFQLNQAFFFEIALFSEVLLNNLIHLLSFLGPRSRSLEGVSAHSPAESINGLVESRCLLIEV